VHLVGFYYENHKKIFREYYTIRKHKPVTFWQRNYGSGVSMLQSTA